MKKHSIKQLLSLYGVAIACLNGFGNEYSRDAAAELLTAIEAEIESRTATKKAKGTKETPATPEDPQQQEEQA